MPWKPEDASKHVKGLTPKQARAWAHIANRALAACEADGGKNCDAAAIKQANAVAQRLGEAEYTEQWLAAELTEKGRVLSADSEKSIRAALAAIQNVLAKVTADVEQASESAVAEPVDPETEEPETDDQAPAEESAQVELTSDVAVLVETVDLREMGQLVGAA